MVRLPGIAPGLPPWRGGILAVKAQPRKLEGPGEVLTLPALRHFNKEQTPLGDRFDPNPRFHGGCFGVWGTPPPKPLNCKIRFALPDRAIDPRGHTTSVTIQSSSSPN